MLLKSNPCNPTGVAATGDALRAIVDMHSAPGRGALIDEAYEFFVDPEPESALRYIDDIDATDIFVVGAATKGLQVRTRSALGSELGSRSLSVRSMNRMWAPMSCVIWSSA